MSDLSAFGFVLPHWFYWGWLAVMPLIMMALDRWLSQRGVQAIDKNAEANEKLQQIEAELQKSVDYSDASNGFTKAVAFEYGPVGITCNAISPGGVETDLMMDSGPAAAESMGITYEEFKDGYAQEASIKRLNTVEEVAAVALLLVSPAGGGITGANMPVDGGTAL